MNPIRKQVPRLPAPPHRARYHWGWKITAALLFYEYFGIKRWPQYTLSAKLGVSTVLVVLGLTILGYSLSALLRGQISMYRWGTVNRSREASSFWTVWTLWTLLGIVCLIGAYGVKYGRNIG